VHDMKDSDGRASRVAASLANIDYKPGYAPVNDGLKDHKVARL